jgi:hypothetical protein
VKPVEILARDADVVKGVGQLKQIREFLLEKPDYLYEQGKLPRRLSEYANAYYLLVARDHWLWIEMDDGIAIAEFEAFAAALIRHENLHLASN